MKRIIYLLPLLFVLMFKVETKAQVAVDTLYVSGNIFGLGGATTTITVLLVSAPMPTMIYPDANGDYYVELLVDPSLLPSDVQISFLDCSSTLVDTTIAADLSDPYIVFNADYCSSGSPFGIVNVNLSNTNGELAPVNIFVGTYGATLFTDASGLVTAAVPYTDPFEDIFIEHYTCFGVMRDTLLTNEDLSAGPVIYNGSYCDTTGSTSGDVTVVVHLMNTGGVNVPVMIVTDGFMYPVVTDANGDATEIISVADLSAPIDIMYTDCNSQFISQSVFVAPGTMTAMYVGEYCAGGAIDSCGVLFTVSYNPTDNIFYLEMDSSVDVNNVEFIWDFGDGSIDSTQCPTHMFDDNILYNVCLYTADVSGTFCSYCHEIGFDSLGNVVTRQDAGFSLQVVPFGTTTGLENLPEPTFELYPNPASDNTVMKLYSDTTFDYTIVIHNAVGQTLKVFNAQAQQGSNTFTLPVNDLVPGYYMVSLEIDNQIVTRSFVK